VKAGFSRIPIYAKGDKNFILGVLLIKSLIGLDLSQEETIEKLIREEKITLRKPLFVHPDDQMIDCLTRFKNGRSHMAIVTDDPIGMEENMRFVYEDDSFQFEDEEEGALARKDSHSRSSQSSR
jgi:CBS domain containing-hemolysin-like protein